GGGEVALGERPAVVGSNKDRRGRLRLRAGDGRPGRECCHGTEHRRSRHAPDFRAKVPKTIVMLELSAALGNHIRARPLIDGSVEVEGVRLLGTTLGGSETFWSQLKFAEFDISEMSMSSLLILAARGPVPWVAIPVFT